MSDPAKKGQKKKATKPKEEKPVYSHESKRRCEAPNKAYARFSGKRCNELLKPDGTLYDSRIKRWICPKCGRRARTEGKLI